MRSRNTANRKALTTAETEQGKRMEVALMSNELSIYEAMGGTYTEVVELSLLGSEQITRIACRRLAITEKSDLALMAWAQEAKIKARNIQTAPINIKGLISAMPEIRKMTALKPKEFCPQIKKCLADCGIALVFLPHLKGSFLQGAS